MKSTRRGFGRRALTFGLAIFCAITLTSVGFAAWILSNNASLESTGGIKTETVDNLAINIDILNEKDNVLYEDESFENLENIAFAPIGLPSEGQGVTNHPANSGLIQNDGNGQSEDLSFTVKGTVDNINKIGNLRFNVKVPESLIVAAGLIRPTESDGTWKYDPSKAFIQLPSYAMDKDGKAIPYIKGILSSADDQGEVRYEYPQSDDPQTTVVELTGDKLIWTESVTWENPGEGLVSAVTSTTISCASATKADLNVDRSGFVVKPLLKEGVVVEGSLSFEWKIDFHWGARYLGMNPNYFYDVDERVKGTHDTLTTAEDTPNKYSIANMNLVQYDLLLMQTVVNGLDIEKFLTASDSYVDTGITLTEGQTIEEFILDENNASLIGPALEKLQDNIITAVSNLGKGGLPSAPVYGFCIFADVN